MSLCLCAFGTWDFSSSRLEDRGCEASLLDECSTSARCWVSGLLSVGLLVVGCLRVGVLVCWCVGCVVCVHACKW